MDGLQGERSGDWRRGVTWRAATGLAIALGLAGCGWLPGWAGGRRADPDRPLTVVSFNLQSGHANPDYLAREAVAAVPEADLWGLSEVADASWLERFDRAAEGAGGGRFETILGTTGGDDRLGVVYGDRLELVGTSELSEINAYGRVRAPLVARFRVRFDGQASAGRGSDSEGANSEEFLFLVNHLYRSDREARHQQARLLNQWARSQTLPVVAVGDYNFDWDAPSNGQRRDRGYDFLTEGGVFVWVRPAAIVPTHCSDRYQSVLDFVFVAGTARDWSARSEILFPEASYCPDDRRQSDHRPVLARFRLD